MMKVVLLLLLMGPFSGQAFASDNVNIVRWVKGTVEYRELSSGKANGSEEWHITVHPDGSRTLQTRNRLDEAGIQRHVIHRVAESFRPLEISAVFWVNGEWRGTGLFSIDGHSLEAVVKTPDGLIRQTRAVPDHFSFIPHPLQTNAWPTWYYDKANGGPQTITVYDMDPAAQAVSSMLGKMYEQTVIFMGETEMTTPAGTFEVDHFRIGDAVDLYITGPDAIMVRFVWEPADRDYVLTSLETGP